MLVRDLVFNVVCRHLGPLLACASHCVKRPGGTRLQISAKNLEGHVKLREILAKFTEIPRVARSKSTGGRQQVPEICRKFFEIFCQNSGQGVWRVLVFRNCLTHRGAHAIRGAKSLRRRGRRKERRKKKKRGWAPPALQGIAFASRF